jgi:hypothetical protein
MRPYEVASQGAPVRAPENLRPIVGACHNAAVDDLALSLSATRNCINGSGGQDDMYPYGEDRRIAAGTGKAERQLQAASLARSR